MADFAFWRRLDTPGHDAALLAPAPSGWILRGTAVFKHGGGPASLSYVIGLNPDWTTRNGRIAGFLCDREICATVARHPSGWTLNHTLVPGLEHLVDLDLGFTPATNLQQLRRVAMSVGDEADVPVAWLDVDAKALTELRQRYRRSSESTYWYEAPTIPYEATLELSANGFVSNYPGLWKAEPGHCERC